MTRRIPALLLGTLLVVPCLVRADEPDAETNEPLLERVKRLEERLAEYEADRVDQELALPEEPRYHLYGFFDISFQYAMIDESVRGREVIPQTTPTFIFGHLNLYNDFRPVDGWRVLAEIGFTVAPLGDIDTYSASYMGTSFAWEDVRANDVTEMGSVFTWGGVEIERAWAEWNAWEPLMVRVGLFLTPFGIWNVDHGSPTRPTVVPPLMYSTHFGGFPERQLGIEVLGRARAAGAMWEYFLTLSNGTGPTSEYFDLDAHKALGARLKVSGVGETRWHVGLSAYWGRFTDLEQVLILPEFDVSDEVTVRYDDLVLGVDASVRLRGVELQAEVVASWREYEEGHRGPPRALDSPLSLEPDRWAIGAYGLAAYDLPLATVDLRPYLLLSYIDWNDTNDQDDTIGMTVGLRWSPAPPVALKFEYQHWRWLEEADDPVIFLANSPFHLFLTQLSMVF